MNDPWVVYLALLSIAVIAFGALGLAWTRRRLGFASAVLLVLAVAAWVLDFVALTTDFRDADGLLDCGRACTPMHRLVALGFVAPPLLIAIAAAGMVIALIARGRRRRRSA
jgi:hypothetical protein